MNELQAASENPEWKLEEELKKHWPSAVEGDFEHPEKSPNNKDRINILFLLTLSQI